MSAPCPTCQAVICSDTADDALYSIESALFPFVFNCPPGFDCGHSTGFKMICCGTLFSVDFPPGASADDKTTLIQGVVNQCTVQLAACNQNPGCLNPPCDPPPPTTDLFYNRDATCSINCPDTTTFVYTVVAGTFAALTQEDADKQALDYACQQVALRRVCMGNFDSCLCAGSAYSRQINVTGGLPPFVFTLLSGALPGGLSLSRAGEISGTPTTPGVFVFRVGVESGAGGSVQKQFQISVLEISTTTIPAFTVGTAYSYQMLAAGGSGLYSWSISTGALPDGLVMSQGGLITGTPTTASISEFTIKVIDLTCEAAVQTQLPPTVRLSGKSTTTIATVRGYSEFPGFVSSPPKKFRGVSWSGSSEQQLWYQGVQIGGAKFDFGDLDQIDNAGNVISTHTKILSLMCDGAVDSANIVGPPYPPNTTFSRAASFRGYFGTNSVQYSNLFGPTQVCATASIPYTAKGDVAAPTPLVYPALDTVGLWGSVPLGGPNAEFVGTAKVDFQSNTLATSADDGTTTVSINPYALPLIPPGVILETFSQIQTRIGLIPRPVDWGVDAQIIFTNAYSAELLDEYTDADALAHAYVQIGNGTTAQNFPRTTGFVTQFTNVVFQLTCGGLVVGKGYLVSYDLWNQSTGVVTVGQVGFNAEATTKTIFGTVPTPPAGQSITVRNPRIAFSP